MSYCVRGGFKNLKHCLLQILNYLSAFVLFLVLLTFFTQLF